MTWWESLEEHLRELEETDDAPDPWSGVDLGDRTLTDEQIAYLGFDQPEAPRLRNPAVGLGEDGSLGDGAGEGTGNSPGDD
jgi:hypothetical protein